MTTTNRAAGLAVAAALTLGAAAPAAAEDYKIGLMLPFSGVYAALGEHIENGFNLGVEHFGGLLEGEHTLEFAREDTEAKPAVGLAKAKKLVLQDRVDVLTGIVSSAVLGGLRDFVHSAEIPLVVANAGNDHMTGERCSPYLVRVSHSNSQTVQPMGGYLAERGVETAYLMAPDYAAGHQMMDTFRAEFEAAGGTIVGEAFPPLQGTKDYGPYLAGVKAAEPDALFTFFAGGAAIAFVKQYDEFGMKEEVPLYGAGFLTSAAYVHVQGEAADGIVASLHYVPTLDNPANTRFQQAYQAKHGRLGSEFAVFGYDAARLIIEAIAEVGDDKEKLAATLPTISFTGPRGPLRIDPETNNVVQNIYIYRNEWDGEKIEQNVLATFENVKGPGGCAM